MMKCTEIRKKMPLYAGGDLSRRDADGVSRHLMDCPDCFELFESWRNGVRVLADHREKRKVPAGTWGSFFKKVERGIYKLPPVREKVLRIRPARKLAIAAAIFIVALFTGAIAGIIVFSPPEGATGDAGITIVENKENGGNVEIEVEEANNGSSIEDTYIRSVPVNLVPDPNPPFTESDDDDESDSNSPVKF